MWLRRLLQVSALKTVRFNIHYFGLQGLIRMPVLVARNYFFRTLRGGVVIDSPTRFCVRLGCPGTGTVDQRFRRGCWEVEGEVHFAGSASFGHGSAISVGPDGVFSVGDGFACSATSTFICQQNVTFGNSCTVSWDSLVMDSDFHSINGEPTESPVHIGNGVWIGCRATILKGATVPDGSVVAAGAIITKSMSEADSIYGGVNQKLRENIIWSHRPSNARSENG